MTQKLKFSDGKKGYGELKSVRQGKKKQKVFKNIDGKGPVISKRGPRKAICHTRALSKGVEGANVGRLVHQKKAKGKVSEAMRKEELLHQLSSSALHRFAGTSMQNNGERRTSVEKDPYKRKEKSRDRVGLSSAIDLKERPSEPGSQQVNTKLNWFVSPHNGTKSSLNISNEQKRVAKFLRNQSERHLGMEEHRASVEPTEKRELGKSQRIKPSHRDAKKYITAISSQLETKRINGGSLIETKEQDRLKVDTKRGKLKGMSKSRRELHSDLKAGVSLEKKKLMKSVKSHISLKPKPTAGGRQTERREKKKQGSMEYQKTKVIDIAKLVKNLSNLNPLRSIKIENNVQVIAEDSRRALQKKSHKVIGKVLRKKKKPASLANVSLAKKTLEQLRIGRMQRVDMVSKEIKSSDSSEGPDNDSRPENLVASVEKKDHSAVVTIQRYTRGFLARKQSSDEKSKPAEEKTLENEHINRSGKKKDLILHEDGLDVNQKSTKKQKLVSSQKKSATSEKVNSS